MLSAIFVEEEIIPEKEPSLFKVAVQQSESQEYQPKLDLNQQQDLKQELKLKQRRQVKLSQLVQGKARA